MANMQRNTYNYGNDDISSTMSDARSNGSHQVQEDEIMSSEKMTVMEQPHNDEQPAWVFFPDTSSKKCNCKKSKCLKLYCQCFSDKVYCTEHCSCSDCFNKPINKDMVFRTQLQLESRNPLAFAPKVIRNSYSSPQLGVHPYNTPATARYKRGCNCKKSSCLQKYCKCFQGGVGCSISFCGCEGCKNAYGRRDEAEPGKAKACEEVEKEVEIKDIEGPHDLECALLPSPPSRLPFSSSSKGKPPKSVVDTIKGSQPTLTNPVTCIQASSPNSKRITTPISHLGPVETFVSLPGPWQWHRF